MGKNCRLFWTGLAFKCFQKLQLFEKSQTYQPDAYYAYSISKSRSLQATQNIYLQDDYHTVYLGTNQLPMYTCKILIESRHEISNNVAF